MFFKTRCNADAFSVSGKIFITLPLSFSIVATELHTQFSLELLTFAAIFTIRNEDESKLSNTLCAPRPLRLRC